VSAPAAVYDVTPGPHTQVCPYDKHRKIFAQLLSS
jgi:hypothetical protein